MRRGAVRLSFAHDDGIGVFVAHDLVGHVEMFAFKHAHVGLFNEPDNGMQVVPLKMEAFLKRYDF
ncbi:MAG: hypothetical protein JW706_02560 [Opitutales bacterium]|nr:hypothetical protein [Opitutales bacterium]